jgi:hypothetical protein
VDERPAKARIGRLNGRIVTRAVKDWGKTQIDGPVIGHLTKHEFSRCVRSCQALLAKLRRIAAAYESKYGREWAFRCA